MLTENDFALKIIHISDTHIDSNRDLLKPMINRINDESADLVVVTGDLVDYPDAKLFKQAKDSLDMIDKKVVVIPGDYDGGELWKEFFGEPYQTFNMNGYALDFLDTSAMGHQYYWAWSDVLEDIDKEQHDWFINSLDTNERYHIVFSHHPFWNEPRAAGDKYIRNNIRAFYSGHLHEQQKVHFKYTEPMRDFENGFELVPANFHGNSVYNIVLVRKDTDEIINVPRYVKQKATAW